MGLPKSVWRWAFYDFANSSYILTYVSLLLPLFFSTILIKNGYSLSAWGVANAIATVLGVIGAVVVGKYSDRNNKFKAFKWSIYLSFIGMVVVALSVKYKLDWVYYLFIFTQAVYIVSLSLSDSILPHLANDKDTYGYSGFAWGFGYVGGIFALVIVLLLQKLTGDDYNPIVFLSTAFFYLVFSIYSLRGLKEVKMNEPLPMKKNHLINIFSATMSYCLFAEFIFNGINGAVDFFQALGRLVKKKAFLNVRVSKL